MELWQNYVHEGFKKISEPSFQDFVDIDKNLDTADESSTASLPDAITVGSYIADI